MFAKALSIVLISSAFLACGDDATGGDASISTNPDAATVRPDATTVHPDAAQANPDAAMTHPDAAMANPDAAMTHPDAAMANPDAAMTNPDAAMSNPDAGMGPDAGAPVGGFAPVYAIIQANCSCHFAGAGGLNMGSEQAAYTNLVGVAAAGCLGVTRVTPGSPALSHMHLKVTGTQAANCGQRMPRGGPNLSQADQDTIRDWIAAGATR